MVLAYHGTNLDQQVIARQLQTRVRLGTPISRVSRLASEKLDVNFGMGQLVDIQTAITQGLPVIAPVRTDQLSYWEETVFHAVVVTGFDGDEIVLNDPAVETPNLRVSTGELMLAWDEMDNRLALLRRK
jgi:uncharacterized protein YvpB